MIPTSLTPQQHQQLQDTYRYLHSNPELSMQEHNTAKLIEDRLDEFEIRHFRCGGTGVVGILENGEGPIVAFRADSDALPIKEATGAQFASTATGTLPDGTEVPVMHGCGHDMHVSVALATAEIFTRHKDKWSGTIIFIFQPGEETAEGSRAMVADGLWDKAPRPKVVLGQHVMPLPAGHIGITSGDTMALADSLKVTLHGQQSHGSQPQDSIDPIVLGAHIITRLQSIVSRELPPLTPAVITCGTFHAGLKENIIPENAELTLNIRTLTQEVREQVLAAVERIIHAEAKASGAPSPVIQELYTFPRLYNHAEHAEQIFEALQETVGEERISWGPPKMGSEDFGWLGDSIDVPTVFWFFGGMDPSIKNPPVNHSPMFLPLEKPSLETGVAAAVSALRSYVKN